MADARRRAAEAAYCSLISGARPKALMTRMPVAASSASVVRSPCWSCTRRETTVYPRRNRIERNARGRIEVAVTRASGAYSRNSRTITSTNVTLFTIRKTRPNPTNRRMTDRSAMARLRSWPECHRSWNDAGSDWRWA